MNYDDYENYYEPSEVDQLVEEFRDKVREHLLPNIREEIERLNKENGELQRKNNEYKNREAELNSKERDLKYKEENLKREVEREFYASNIGDTLKDYIEKAEVWFADNKGFEQEKCSLCNNERRLIAKFKNKKTTEIDCDCKRLVYKYVPEISELSLIKFNKKDSRYQSDRNFYFSRSYTPSKNSNYDYSYNEFKLDHIVDEFNDDTKELYENKKYNAEIGFKTKEECQKYCDWLNNRNPKSYDEDKLEEYKLDDED
jgi:hypothetical protein